MDPVCLRYVRTWLELPVNACLKEVLSLPRNRAGLGIGSHKSLAEKMRLQKRHSLKSSCSDDVRSMWSETSVLHVETDSSLMEHKTLQLAKSAHGNAHRNNNIAHVLGLKQQDFAFKSVLDSISLKEINTWSDMLDSTSAHIFSFARKALLQVLPTAANLARWKRLADPQCVLCASGKPQTNRHVLSNCSSPIALKRYAGRHNDALRLLVGWLKSVLSKSQTLYANLDDVQVSPVRDLFNDLRPDIVVGDAMSITTWELTVCHELNLQKSKIYKSNKYIDLVNHRTHLAANKLITSYTIEISTLGFISDTNGFCKAINISAVPVTLKKSLMNSVINSSFSIYCKRNCNVD